jgi:hypothetical protein
MRLLDRFFGKKTPEFTERIWLTTERKIDDLIAQIRQCQSRGGLPVAVAHFPATLQRLLGAFEKCGLTVRVISGASQFPTELPEASTLRPAILVLSSEAIALTSLPAPGARPETGRLAPVSVHLAEHYPSPDRDRDVLALVRVWSRPIDFICYTGLDEPWLALFGIEGTRQLIAKLGVSEETLLTHPVLHSAIQTAQRRIAQRVRHEQRCDSCEEWMRCNYPRGSE